MTIDRFREVLGAVGPPPDARELSELLWLACHISGPEETAPPAPVRPQRPVSAPPGPPGFTTPRSDGPVPVPPVPLTALHPAPGPSPVPEPAAGAAAEVLVPTAPMLADPLGVQRALRPLKRRVPSRHRAEVDEEATAARIADTRRWTPVLVPSPERWLSLTLVVDTGPTMRLWRPLARELAETLLRQGAFQDLHVSYLGATGRVTSAPGAPSQDPGTLLDASGRHAVLVLSDCSGPHWWDGHAAQAVRRWARAGPTAILQPLPEHLWRRTAAPASPGLALLPRPGAPNTDLRFSPFDGAAAPGVPVPVLEVAPRWFGAWARLLSGSDPQPTAIATLPPRPPGTAPPARERELPVAERVRRFLATASPAAAELAAHVAVSVPSLPVMRLIQHRILGRSGPGQLAEVLLSGLLRPAGGVRYEFVPGAREALLDTLPRPEAQHTRHVLEAVSAEIERRAGTSAETFRALLPAEGGPVTLTTDTDHFAVLAPETRTRLTSPPPATAPPDLLELLGTPVEELLGPGWTRPPHPTLIGADGPGKVWLDLLRSSRYGPHGMITGPRPVRDALLRTIVFSLALSHSPDVVTFAFADFSGGASFVGLGNLPHVATAVHTTSAESPLISRLPGVLETERRRREALLQDAGIFRWGDYQAAIAEGRPLEPLPALIVFVDNTGPMLEARPDLIEPIMALCRERPAQGIRFVFCSPDEVAFLHDLVAWRIEVPGDAGPGRASLRVYGEHGVPSFRPAHISLDAGDPIVARMRESRPRTRRLPWPDETAPHPEATVPPPDTSARPASLPEFDVLKLNGGGRSGMFEETWARPALEPRDPAIGYDPDGDVVTLYPLDIAAGIPHGLIVGETEARQHTVRNIALALASNYSPGNLSLAFAGLGEHPLGEPLDLPHVVFSNDELLGRPQHLRRALGYLAGELESRAADQPGSAPGLLVFADVSLTFPPGQREMAEALLSLAQRGRTLGVQLLVSASTVDDTTTWNRFLPLLGWRVAASRLPPDVLRRILGQANLQFPDERTAYLRAGNNSPRQFTLAPDPPRPAIDDFVQRTRHHWHVIWGQSEEGHPDTAIAEVLRRLRNSETQTRPPDERRPRHIVYAGTDMARIARLAAEYGRMLAELGVLSHGDVREATVDWLCSVKGEPGTTMADVFRESRGGVLLLHMAREAIAPAEVVAEAIFPEQLQALVREHGEDPVVIVCADDGQMIGLRRFDPFFTDRYRRLLEFPKVKDAGTPPDEPAEAPPDLPELVYARELPAVTGRRIPIGIASGTRQPVYVYFDTDPHLLVAGPPRSGRANAVQLLIDGIRARQGGAEAEIHVFDAHEILLSLAEEYGLTEAAGADVGYTDSAEDFRETVAGLVRRPPDAEVFLFVIDRDLDDDPLRTLPHNMLTSPGSRIHLVLARLLTVVDQRVDPVVSTLHEIGAPALLLGSRYGEENRLYGAEPPAGPAVVGRGVLVRGGRRHVLQVAHASPFA